MKHNVTLSNAVRWYKFALDFSMEDVMDPCQQIICSNFIELSREDLFILDVAALKKILLSSEIVVDKEQQIVDFIFEWLRRRPSNDEEREKLWEPTSQMKVPQ
jgi:hypothetical protein